MSKKKSADKQLIYVGPNLMHGRAQQYAVFQGGIPAHLNELRDQHPEIDELIVEVSELSKARQQIATPGTPKYEAYQRLIRKGA